MKDDAVFRSSTISLAAIIVLMGLYTQSLQKMVATYFFGMFVICGVLLPDWEFFNRSVSQWCTPVTIPDMGSQATDQKPSFPTRFKIYPVRLVVYALVYGFAFYKWWKFISN
ncbi:signal peptidase complex DTM1 [Olea europaea subsp. europaea]|uniref:Signal peptidase complex DTM1 n=1 Tax=Olea europaea subsp. europaea TaxID=158383 RepID=A0A8S0TBG6_OLEEU|nr:signal peptidase complex DTM1 [Olea europaea subsp. europaea]